MAELDDLDLATLARDFQTRLLNRLPASLWDQSPETVQGQLYGALATELARWFETRRVVRDATLLQRAAGVDLDVLLRDYHLKRYNQRPDAFAREIARLILWTTKGTLYSLQDLAQLFVETPQLLARSGRHQPHWWTAIMRPLLMARTYWQFGAQNGQVWYISLEENSIAVGNFPPPGANMTPWPDGYAPTLAGPPPYAGGLDDVMPVYWCLVPDQTDALWYMSIAPDGAIALAETAPGPEPGTTQPLHLWDGQGGVWGVQVDRNEQSLTVVSLSTPPTNPTYWTLVDELGDPWILYMREGALTLERPPASLLWSDVTPGGVPLAWWRITGTTDAPRYAHVRHDPLVLISDTPPPGDGTEEPLILRDSEYIRLWEGVIDATGREIELHPIPEPPPVSGAPLPVRDPGHVGQYLCLYDTLGQPWYIWRLPSGTMQVCDSAPTTLVDATPPGGPFTWWRLEDRHQQPYAVWVDTGPRLRVGDSAPPGIGTAQPVALGSADSVLWHNGMPLSGSLGATDQPPLDFAQAPTCLIMNDPHGDRWFVRLNGLTGGLVITAVLDPDVIPWQSIGELCWLRAPDPHGDLPRYIMVSSHYTLEVRHAPSVGQPWGLDARDCPLYDSEGYPWLLVIGHDGSVRPQRQFPQLIPGLQPILYVRDCAEALRHVEAGGSLTTLWAV